MDVLLAAATQFNPADFPAAAAAATCSCLNFGQFLSSSPVPLGACTPKCLTFQSFPGRSTPINTDGTPSPSKKDNTPGQEIRSATPPPTAKAANKPSESPKRSSSCSDSSAAPLNPCTPQAEKSNQAIVFLPQQALPSDATVILQNQVTDARLEAHSSASSQIKMRPNLSPPTAKASQPLFSQALAAPISAVDAFPARSSLPPRRLSSSAPVARVPFLPSRGCLLRVYNLSDLVGSGTEPPLINFAHSEPAARAVPLHFPCELFQRSQLRTLDCPRTDRLMNSVANSVNSSQTSTCRSSSPCASFISQKPKQTFASDTSALVFGALTPQPHLAVQPSSALLVVPTSPKVATRHHAEVPVSINVTCRVAEGPISAPALCSSLSLSATTPLSKYSNEKTAVKPGARTSAAALEPATTATSNKVKTKRRTEAQLLLDNNSVLSQSTQVSIEPTLRISQQQPKSQAKSILSPAMAQQQQNQR